MSHLCKLPDGERGLRLRRRRQLPQELCQLGVQDAPFEHLRCVRTIAGVAKIPKKCLKMEKFYSAYQTKQATILLIPSLILS